MSSQIDRYEAIREYIIENDGCTKTDVINVMDKQKTSSTATTHKIIQSMVRDGIVIFEPDKKNRQIHHLHINDNYSKIDRQINKIKELMDKMDKPIKTYLKNVSPNTGRTLTEDLENPREPTNNEDFYNHFIFPYEESISMMIKILFAKINETILTEKDTHSLRLRLMLLSIRLTKQVFNISKEKEYLDYNICELKTFHLSTTNAYAQKKGVNVGIRKDIIKQIQEFQEKFLT